MIRPLQDNVVIVIEPLETQTASGLTLVNVKNPKDKARASRTARVIASGPGYWRTARRALGNRQYSEPTEVFIPNETKPGDRVIVDADPGQDYRLDVTIPRTNLDGEFSELIGEKGEFRIVRESGEIYAILEDVPEAAE